MSYVRLLASSWMESRDSAMDIESVAFLPEASHHQQQAARSDLGPVGQQQQQQQQSSITELQPHHPLRASFIPGGVFNSGHHHHLSSTFNRSQGNNSSSEHMPSIAAANQLLSSHLANHSSSSPSSTTQNNHLAAAAELPITSSGVRIASPTSRPSKQPPPPVPFIHLNQAAASNLNHQGQTNHNQISNHQGISQSTVLLPSRALQPPSTGHRSTTVAFSSRTSSSFWRSLFSGCIAEETERTIACTDRVIYRPTADDEEPCQVVTTSGGASSCNNRHNTGNSRRNRRNHIQRRRRRSSSSSSGSDNSIRSSTIMACCSGRSGGGGGGCGGRYRQCLQRLAVLIILLLLAAILLEVVHILTNTCGQSWLSHLLPSSLGAAFNGFKPSNSPDNSSSSSSSSTITSTTPSSIDILFNDTNETTESPLPYLDTDGAHYPWQAIRLPSYLRPKSYELYLSPTMVYNSDSHNLNGSSSSSSSHTEPHPTFINRGNVSIEFEITASSAAFIVLHSKKLNISKVAVTQLGGHHLNLTSNLNSKESKSLPVTRVVECTRLEQLYIELGESLTAGNVYQITLEFSRTLEDELEGFYVSSYAHSSRPGTKQYLLTTHFEPTLARTAFPCFDEPALKATFRLRLLHDSHYSVFFNTEIVETKIVRVDGGRTTRTLSISETTVPMSTYLVAFVVCDFAVSSVKNDGGIVVRTVVPEEQNAHTAYALQFGSKVISFFEKFFKVEYPLRKLDMVAVPDFSAGAMENWGIITFRTTTLLYNEKESSSEMQEQVATVISHEIAHQWFGNLVTMNWWSELWLNEGFASYVENLGVDNIHPEWRMLDQFVISTTQLALSIDSLFTSHPIHTTVANPSEIEAIFDMISYKKGACLIRMIEDFLGKENLQLGLEKYLNRYKFSTATTKQLWESMSEVSSTLPINVSTIMDTWIIQQGYPVISARWSDDGQHILVSQRRFVSSVSPEEFERQLTLGNNGSNPLFSSNQKNSLRQQWIVPLTLISSQSSTTSAHQLFWLTNASLAIPLRRSRASGKSGWFKLNHQQCGFYRVNYETSIWRDLIQWLVNSTPESHFLSATDRAGLLDDALSLMRIGHLDVNTALDLTRYLETGEQDYVPWETVLNHLAILDTLMLQHPALHRYALRLLAPLVARLGWTERPTDSLFEKKLRSIVLRSAVYFGDQGAIGRARAEFAGWLATGKKPPANFRDIVYHAGTQWGGDREWQAVWRAYLAAGDASEKRLLLGALGSTRNHYLLASYLAAALNRTLVRTQDLPYAIQNVARNPNGRLMAWQFIKAHWAAILATFGGGSFSLDAIISETTWHFASEYEYADVKEFFGRVSVGSGRQAVRQSMEKIRANIYWKASVEAKVIRWLNATTSAVS